MKYVYIYIPKQELMESEDEAQQERTAAWDVAKAKETEVKAAQSGRQNLNKVGAEVGNIGQFAYCMCFRVFR